MPIEPERKFLVTTKELHIVRNYPGLTVFDVEDRYVEALRGGPPLRVRTIGLHQRPETKQVVLAVKTGLPPLADEIEYPWPSVPFLTGPLTVKRRLEWRDEDRVCHIDDYSFPTPPNYELIAEVEFPSAEELIAFIPPAHWVEITGRKEYSNYSIAKYGWPTR